MPKSSRITNLYIHKQIPNFADSVETPSSDEILMLRIAVVYTHVVFFFPEIYI